jgi:hypothetical protein
MTITAPASITAGDPATTGQVTLSAPTATELFIPISSSLPGVTTGIADIKAGQTSATFTISAAANSVPAPPAAQNVVFGIKTAFLTGKTTGYETISGAIDVIDNLKAALTVQLSSNVVGEGGTVTGTVTRNTADTSNPLVVTLFSTDPAHAFVPTTVVILAGQTQATFTVTGVQDFQIDNPFSFFANIVAAAEGFKSGSAGLTVFDSFVTLATHYQRIGDQNTIRPQGHIQIIDNTVSFVSQVGIALLPGPRDPNNGNLPAPGSVRALPTLDSTKQVPGADIVNNVINVGDAGQVGILISGDPNPTGLAVGAVPFARIINNTVFGNLNPTSPTTPAVTGIQIQNNAAPTLLNNIVANTNLAISIDASSSQTVVGTEAFQNNVTKTGLVSNGTVGTNPITLTSAFINPSTGNFYLKEGSKAIDSSLNTLQDRAQMVAVQSAIGLPQAPIISPLTDRFGQLRVDDPNVPNASGLGNNIFIDRGAIERADFTGPTASLFVPLDNGPGDGDPTVGKVFITSPAPLTEFAIQFSDVGVGIDNATISSADFVLKQDGVTLVAGTDYQFVYNTNTHIAEFKSASLFSAKSTYTITVNNKVVADLAGNLLQPNQSNGTSVYTIVGNAPPTLTTISTLQGLENLPITITYAQLLAASDLTVVVGHTPEFQIQAVTNGTLLIEKSGTSTFVAVIPGTTVVAPGDTLKWTPPTDFLGTTAAFSVVGFDPQNAVIAPALSQSSPAVQVNINVRDLSPVLTTVNTLGPAGQHTPFSMSFASFLAASDGHTVDGTQVAFQIQSISQGTLQILKAGTSTPVDVVIGTSSAIFGPNDFLIWTGPAGVFGPSIAAFTVEAYDAFNAANIPSMSNSSPAVQVNINVLQASAPSVAPSTTLTKPRFVTDTITFNDLFSNLSTSSSNPVGFRIDNINSGTLLLQVNGVGPGTPVTIGTVMHSTDNLLWTSTPGATGLVSPAFAVAAVDLTNGLASTDALININLVNVAPTLTTINTLQIADQSTPFPITFNLLKNASNAADPNNDAIKFRINTVQPNGTLTITHNGTTTNVVAGTTLFGAGDTLTWTPGAGVSGNAVNAFTVSAFDGSLSSSSPVQVTIKVRPLGTAFDLTGVWTRNGGLARISQTGASLTLVGLNGQGSSGTFLSLNKISGFGMTGTVDLSTPDQGRIVWSNGFIWLRISLGGTYAVNGQVATISQNGVALTVNPPGGSPVTGSISSATQISAPAFGGTASFGDGTINWGNGQVWTKLDLATNYTSSINGQPAQIIQNGSVLTFTDENSVTTTGMWVSPTTLVGRSGLTATIATNGQIHWSNGDIWSEQLTVFGANGGNGVTKISVDTSTPNLITLTGVTGLNSTARITSPTTLVVVSGPLTGLSATRKNGKLFWSNGAVWDNFDFNALNAMFSTMVHSYPFPS